MKYSLSFAKTLRNAPKDEVSRSAQLLLRAGYLHKELAGVYSFLPLGLRVLEKLKQIIRHEMNQLGSLELQLTALQDTSSWEATGRWDDQVLDVWFKTKLQTGTELGLAPTHEEPITQLMKAHIRSYKDLPVSAYQFQTKFRNELRAKSGILRTREFLMKDLYSFALDQQSHQQFYDQVAAAYQRIFKRVGMGDRTYQTFASGGSFAKYSHEFQTLTPVGEDTIWHTADFSICLNEEVLNDAVLADLGIARTDLIPARASEVGNIFTLGTKYSDALKLTYLNDCNQQVPVYMGSYGIGVSRLMGLIAEVFAREQGLYWPPAVAPFLYYLVPIGDQALEVAERLHQQAPDLILLDDRPLRNGEKFADADLLGLPYRVVISDKTLASQQIEFLDLANQQTTLLTLTDFESKL